MENSSAIWSESGFWEKNSSKLFYIPCKSIPLRSVLKYATLMLFVRDILRNHIICEDSPRFLRILRNRKNTWYEYALVLVDRNWMRFPVHCLRLRGIFEEFHHLETIFGDSWLNVYDWFFCFFLHFLWFKKKNNRGDGLAQLKYLWTGVAICNAWKGKKLS